MAGLFGNRMSEPERNLRGEIERTEFKKQSIIAPLRNEILAAQQTIDRILHQIGTEVYNAHAGGQDGPEGLQAHFDAIGQQKSFIGEKEAKINEFAARYDEEINMLKANLNQMMAQYAQPQSPQYPPQPAAPAYPAAPAQPGGGKAFCGSCGAPYTPGQDAFCGGCGNKLQ